ncbi:MAG: DNA topoisomerase I [Promethearchaeota archaeon]
MKQLIHNGIRVSEIPAATEMKLIIRGQTFLLDAVQEQMAMAFVAKRHLGYWEDSVFVRNFLKDFSKALGLKPVLKPQEINLETLFHSAIARREEEQQRKESMTKEERKALRAKRKVIREALREKFGYAEIDGERVEISNWTAEPSCIFMGRGKHPLRGRWKPGPREQDITLNLDPKAPMPPGSWAGRTWAPDSLWIAQWYDRLSGKIKYVWVSDTAPLKQDREAEKLDLSLKLSQRITRVRQHIQKGMESTNPRRRQIATACYLIDVLSLRVGDEKDPDEADTVGATTLRPEHITIKDDSEVEFRFLGKDSVPWHKTARLPPEIVEELQHLIENAQTPIRGSRSNRRHPTRDKPQIFPNVRSRNVNAFLSEIMPGLTAKVFRTHHASSTVRTVLGKAKVTPEDPDYMKKYHAKLANLQAAVVCNHTKQTPKGWTKRLDKFRQRRHRVDKRIVKVQENLEKRQDWLKELLTKQKATIERTKERGRPIPRGRNRPYASSIEATRRSIETAKTRLAKAKLARDKLKTQVTIAKQTRTWNLGTSLKSYIDPRIYRDWGHRVQYDWKQYYPKALQRKFAWIDNESA